MVGTATLWTVGGIHDTAPTVVSEGMMPKLPGKQLYSPAAAHPPRISNTSGIF